MTQGLICNSPAGRLYVIDFLRAINNNDKVHRNDLRL